MPCGLHFALRRVRVHSLLSGLLLLGGLGKLRRDLPPGHLRPCPQHFLVRYLPGGFPGLKGLKFRRSFSCAAGKYSLAGAGTCVLCPAGSYSVAGASSCTECALGWYSAGAGRTTCTSCPAGTFGGATGLESCVNCNSGHYGSSSGMSVCLNCSAGQYSNMGAAFCKPCIRGTFSLSAGSSVCEICASGFYSGTSGAKTCSSCLAGTAALSGSRVCKATAIIRNASIQVNQPPTLLPLHDVAPHFFVSEKSPAGAAVGFVYVADQDKQQAHTFAILSGTPGFESFAVEATGNNTGLIYLAAEATGFTDTNNFIDHEVTLACSESWRLSK